MKISTIKQKQHIQFTILYINVTDTIRKITKLALQHDCSEKTTLTRNTEMQLCRQ